MNGKSKTLSTLKEIASAAVDKKAENIVILSVAEISNIADYFVFCSGTNSRQNLTISDGIHDSLSNMKVKPSSVEGKSNANWILMDYGDIIVHIFLPDAREFYDLEGLWGDAEKVNIEKLVDGKLSEN